MLAEQKQRRRRSHNNEKQNAGGKCLLLDAERVIFATTVHNISNT